VRARGKLTGEVGFPVRDERAGLRQLDGDARLGAAGAGGDWLLGRHDALPVSSAGSKSLR